MSVISITFLRFCSAGGSVLQHLAPLEVVGKLAVPGGDMATLDGGHRPAPQGAALEQGEVRTAQQLAGVHGAGGPIIGDQCNYWIGHFFGRRILESGKVKAMTPERIEKTEKMIEKWGPLAVFLGRFFPFIRTFMPFISGISGMRWSRFTPFSVLGGLCWSTLFTLLGYFFGGIPAVQKHFELVIIAILVLSLIPTIVGLLKAKFGKKKPAAEDTAETADAE